MTHNLVVNYGLYRKMEVFRPKLVTADELTRFHSDDYVNFLRIITPGLISSLLSLSVLFVAFVASFPLLFTHFLSLNHSNNTSTSSTQII